MHTVRAEHIAEHTPGFSVLNQRYSKLEEEQGRGRLHAASSFRAGFATIR